MKIAWLLLLALLVPLAARAQTEPHIVPGYQTTAGCPGSNTPCWFPYSATNPLPVTPGAASGGATGTPTESTVTCGAVTTALLAASSATQFILIKVPAAATATVWVNVAGVAAVAAPPSVDLIAGQSMLWSTGTGFVPSSALNCISTIANAVTLIYK